MTVDQAVALSLAPSLSRVGLTERLRCQDPTLLTLAQDHLDAAGVELRLAAAMGIQALAWSDPRFPPRLLAIGDAPPVLWYRGRLDALEAPVVAIVGARAASHVSLEVAARLAQDLAARGVTVVSGLARGVDSAAHRGALHVGVTAAVLGSGLNRIYPSEHEALAREIGERGLLVSEHPPNMPPLPHHFPLRNRVISGLARAVVVVEASEKSGSLITAACALEQGREVMAVPGSVLSGRNRGGHALIRDGAKIVETADDILTEIGMGCGAGVVSGLVRDRQGQDAGDAWLSRMEAGYTYDFDHLVSLSGLDGVSLLPRLLELELQGVIARIEGGRFVRPA